jgi:LacI family transcriptional regulator
MEKRTELPKRITVYDIAEELNISTSTVSRVLNNSSLISDERSRQIRDTAEKMGYRKRVIKKHINRVILNLHLFLPETNNQLTHFFYNMSDLIESIQEGFGEVRLNFITRVNDGNLEFLERKKTGQIDGCVFAFTSPSLKLQKELNNRSIPYILLNRTLKNGNFIAYDVPQGIRLLSQKMIDRKGSGLRPCYLGFEKLPGVSQERYETALEFFRDKGIHFDKSSSLDIHSLDEIPSKAVQWVQENGFNAVLAFNDLIALSFLQACQYSGLRIPEDIMLTGFDDSPIQNILGRKIDTISLSIPLLGKMAGQWLKSNIIDRDQKELKEILTVSYVQGQTLS